MFPWGTKVCLQSTGYHNRILALRMILASYSVAIIRHITFLFFCSPHVMGLFLCNDASYWYRISIIKIRQSHECLIFMMETSISGHLITALCSIQFNDLKLILSFTDYCKFLPSMGKWTPWTRWTKWSRVCPTTPTVTVVSWRRTSGSRQRRWRSVNTFTLVSGKIYRQTSTIIGTLVGNKLVDHSDIVGTSVGAAPTTSSFST